MKVIHRGTNPVTIPLIAECGRCRTQIEFLPAEAKYNSDQRDGCFYSIPCPVCAGTITKNVQTFDSYYHNR